MRKTKIVCTIGPASDSDAVLEGLIRAGMNVARLNFSFGTHAEHQAKMERIRVLAERSDSSVAILQDLAGPKIRIGNLRPGGVNLVSGDRVVLTGRQVIGEEDIVPVTYPTLSQEVIPGDRILLSDGMIELRVQEILGQDVVCSVVVGGLLTSHKGINFPTATIRAPAFTEKDRDDLLFGIRNGVDLVGVSYVRNAGDIRDVKKMLRQEGADIPVIAKIERKEALKAIDEIIEVADGIMVARGDLGLETPLEKIPTVQKRVIRQANGSGKIIITATQMLQSMVEHTWPTRAEVTDVVNAIYDGTDAVMLSEETASGKFPLESMAMMSRIAIAAEEEFPFDRFSARPREEETELPRAISGAAVFLADHIGAKAVVTPTESGSTARWVSRLRPRQPILALSRHLSTVRRMNLYWGVRPVLVPGWGDTDVMLERAKRVPREHGIVQPGDKIVVIAGVPIGLPGRTNLIKVETLE